MLEGMQKATAMRGGSPYATVQGSGFGKTTGEHNHNERAL